MTPRRDDDQFVAVDEIPSKGLSRVFDASSEMRADLSARFGFVGIAALRAEFDLKPLAAGPMIRVRGTLTAEIEQSCIVTGEPVAESVSSRFEIVFAPPGMVEENLDLTLSDADPPEPFGPDGSIDLAELAAQQLTLSAEEYPRLDGVDLESALNEVPDGRKSGIAKPGDDNPFAALARLKTDGKPD